MPGLRFQSPVRVHAGGNRPMFLCHIDVSLPLSLPSLLSKNKIKSVFKKEIPGLKIKALKSFAHDCIHTHEQGSPVRTRQR